MPQGTPHTLKNAGAEPVRLINTHRPALRFEPKFRELHSLIKTGRIKRLPPTDLRSLVNAGMLFQKYSDEQHVTKPPMAVSKALALLGRSLRLKLDN